MVKIYNKTKWLLLLLFCSLSGISELYATHMMGGSITYTWVSGNQYRVRCVMYSDCSGITPSSSVSLTITNSCGLTNPSITLPQIAGSPFDQTPLCASATSNCSGGANRGFYAYIYEDLVTLPGACSDWTFAYSEGSRNDALTNSSTGDSYYNYTVLNNTVAPNNAALWTNTMPSFICLNQTFTFNPGAHDVDGDSLYFDLVNPMSTSSSPILWTSPFTATNPFTASTFSLNNFTGEVTIRPTAVQVGNFAIRVREYRNGVLVGVSVRDIQLTVRNCGTNKLNTSEGIRIGGVLTPTPFQVNCAQGLLTFTINAKDADLADVLTMTWDNAFSGPTFTTSGTGGAAGITGTFKWNIPPGTAGIRILTFTVKDNACPYAGVQIYTVKLEFSPVTASPSAVIYCGSPVQLSAWGGDSWTWAPAAGLSCTNCQFPMASPASTTTYTVTNNCGSTANVTVTVPPPFTLTGVANTSICAGQSYNLDVNPNPAVGAYTYSWSPTTGLSNPNIKNPIATPTGTTTYTCTVSNGGCSKTYPVTITINALPTVSIASTLGNNFCLGQSTTLTANAYVTPASCGINMTACTGITNNYTPVGTGTTTTSYPFNGLWHDARSQMIFTKTELNAAGCMGGRIDRLQFNVSTKNSTQAYTSFTIKMGCTTQGSYPGTTLLTGLSTVYSGNYTTTAGVNSIVLSSPYDWDGNSNLVVEFCFDNTSYTSNDYVSASTTASTQTLYYYADNSSGCTLTSMYSSTDRPNVTFRVCSSNVGLTYAWSPAAGLSSTNTATTVATPTSTGAHTYTVRVTGAGCYRDVPITLNVGSVFTVTMSSAATICLGSSTTLSATPSVAGAYTYTWTPATGLSNPNIQNPIASPTATTTYTCAVKNAGGCVVTNTVTVNVNAIGAPVVSASGTPASVCKGSSVSLTSSVAPKCTYTMSNPAYVAVAAGGYTATGLKADDAQTTITLPFSFTFYCQTYTSVSITTNGYIEFGGTTTSYSNVAIPNTSTPNNIIALAWDDLTTSSTGTIQYKTIGTAPNRTFVINYDAVPHVGASQTVTGSILLYEGTNIIDIVSANIQNDGGDLTQGIENSTGTDGIAVSGRNATIWTATNSTYRFTPTPPPVYAITWTDPSNNIIGTTANITHTPTVSGTYTVSYKDASNCTGVAYVPITVISVDAGVDVTICPSQSTNLTAIVSVPTTPSSCGISTIPCSGAPYTIGSGSTTTEYPFRGYYHDSRSQMIFTKTELNAKGITAGMISKLSFNLPTKSSSAPYNSFTIKIGCTAQASFASATWIATGLTTVYTGNYSTVAGTNTFTFSSAYDWDGTSNLILEFCFDNTSYTSNDYVTASTTASSQMVYNYADNDAGCTMVAYSTTTTRPDITFSVCNTYSPTYTWTPATGLSATNIANPIASPTSTTNYKVTINTGTCTTYDSVTVTVTPPASLTWTGMANTDWFNPNNWTPNCIPACVTTVSIPNVSPKFMPLISGANASAGDITIAAGATLTINNTETLNLCGHFINQGTFIANNSTLNFIGTATQNFESNSPVHHVTVNNTAVGNSAYINLLSNMELDNTGILTFVKGRIVTNTDIVYVTNTASAAIVGHNANRYVQGYLDRKVSGTKTYDFPVGLAPTGLGYQLANITFTTAPVFSSIRGHFVDYASTSTPSVLLPDCGGTKKFNCIINNHGKWILDPNIPASSVYNIILYPQGGTSACTSGTWTVMKQPTGSANAWVLQGTSCSSGTNPTRTGLTAFSEFAAVSEEDILPVELLNFTAILEDKNNGRLRWVTANEVNNAGFYLQRSSDAQNFTDLTFVTPAQPDPNHYRSYTWLDRNLQSGIYYYRLRQVDVNGTENFSNVEMLQVGESGLMIYPNPGKEFTNISFSNNDNLPYAIDVYDAQGKLVRKVEQPGGHTYRLEKAELSSGVYFIELTLGTQKWRQRFVLIP